MLDLHGIQHIDVPNDVKRYLEDNWTNYGHLGTIITGHSTRMRRLVAKELRLYGIEPYFEPGRIEFYF
jgi:hypothetical protein